MTRIIYALLIILLIGCNKVSESNDSQTQSEDTVASENIQSTDSPFLAKHPLITLMRKNPVEIGCIFQAEFDYKDPKFNCEDKNYVNNGDPCEKTKEYYEGVALPANLFSKIHPLVSDLNLNFEHGNLREIAITFKDSLLTSKVKEIFGLPSDNGKLPDNVSEISFGENIYSKEKPKNPDYTKWLTITAFEHIGAGEAGCR